MKLCIALAVLVATAAAIDVESEFAAYIDKFDKTYTSYDEYVYRMSVFAKTVAQIEADNAAARASGDSVTFAVNKFSDLTPEEFSRSFKGFRPSPSHAAVKADAPTVTVDYPAAANTVDWRTKGLVTPVKNQGQCGSCWAFSATEQIESDVIRGGNKEVILAPQQIVSCDKVDAGCNGGDTPTAYEYVMKAGGMMPESSYPYRSGNDGADGKCKFHDADVVANVTSWAYVSKSGSTEMSKMVPYVSRTGPVSVCVATGGWQSYQSGVLRQGCGGADEVDHCVQVVGFNQEATTSKSYWIVRNSWAKDWGVDGYIYVELGNNVCDIAGEATKTESK